MTHFVLVFVFNFSFDQRWVFYYEQRYTEGEKWHDGCQYTCECVDAITGHYRCLERCKDYSQHASSGCKLVVDPNDSCCVLPLCTPATRVPFTPTPSAPQVKGRSIGTCTEKAQSVTDKLLAAQNAGSPLYGVEVPRCDTDGTYAGMQYIGSQAYCVTKNGTAINGYMVYRWEAGDMNCQCARDQYDNMQTGLIGKLFNCKANGNYKKVQCTGSVCYCVDMLGQLQGNSTVPISDMDKMSC